MSTNNIATTTQKLNLTEALIGAVYFFLVLCAYYFLKPLRDSSFLSNFSPNTKPFFNLFTMALLFTTASTYNWVVKKVPHKKFLHFFYSFIFINLALFWLGFQWDAKITGTIFFMWVSCANVFLVTVFWTQINNSFNHDKNPYFYVIVGLGGTAGAALGGKLTSDLVPLLGTNSLVLFAAGVILMAYVCGVSIQKRAEFESFEIPLQEHGGSSFYGLLKEQYAVCILVLVIIGTFVQSLYDYQLTTLVAEKLGKNKDNITIFYGDLYYKLNLYSLLAQSLLAPLILATIGPARGLYLLITLIIGTSLILSLDNTLVVMEWVFIIYAGSGYSIIQIFREQLYVPASKKIKVSSKGFIDTFGFRAGDSLSAFAFVIIVNILGFDLIKLDYLVLFSSLIATYYLYKANRIYAQLKSKKVPQ